MQLVKALLKETILSRTGQKNAAIRDIAVQIVRLAESFNCPIACENLDFSKKKASLRHSGSKKYNKILSGFVYDTFRSCLVARAEKFGVEVIFVSPAFSSIIGMIKYMPKYALNSAYSAAMVIARRAMGFKERIPLEWLASLKLTLASEPEDSEVNGFGGRWKKISELVRKNSIRRHQLFNPRKVLEVLVQVPQSGKRKATSLTSTGLSLVRSKSQSPMEAN